MAFLLEWCVSSYEFMDAAFHLAYVLYTNNFM